MSDSKQHKPNPNTNANTSGSNFKRGLSQSGTLNLLKPVPPKSPTENTQSDKTN